mmetsp:Transcript_6488/g.12857  ORF Transcript_6488/g.12857 Transcript_6488/m.12857 type:complete len:224 (-) Transcript_6488:496-1167(-)
MSTVEVRTTYLTLYNVCQAFGWLYVLYKSIHGTIDASSLSGAMPAAGSSVALFQMVSFLEILHALLGLVRGSPMAALLQWVGRSNVLYAIVLAIPEIKSGVAAGAMVLAWSLSEIIRYPWYAAQLKGACPFWLTWLRYTMFIPLYPVGVFGEIVSIYNALQTIASKHMYSISMPNSWNFGFDYAVFLKLVLLVYPLLWWQLYAMLLKTRSKKLPGSFMKKKKM